MAHVESLDPATGEVLARYPCHDEASVHTAVAAARQAGSWWAGVGYAERGRRLRAWRSAVVRGRGELADLVHRETGKPLDDAMLEIVLAVEHIGWAARHAPDVLGPRRVRPGLLMAHQAATVYYEPFGVVGVIGPWNFPVFTPMGSLAYALAAGNAVVFKPSEYTSGVGEWLAQRFAEVVPEHPVLTLVTGGRETGAALCRAGVDKLAFTGSTTTARAVMIACAERLTPVVLECGGKDALVVDADADLDAAADAAAWGALSNAGQMCIGIERVYAVDCVYDEFLVRLRRRTKAVRAGVQYGPVTIPGQLDVVRDHIRDALARGGRAIVGGMGSIRAPYVDPVVLVDVPEDSRAVREETFGPTLTVTRVRDADEAIQRANAVGLGLGAAVFGTRDAADIAGRLRAGMVSINSVISFAGVPALPFGGVGDSGFGRIHGADGLREFARTKSVTRQRCAPLLRLTTFDRRRSAMRVLLTLTRVLHGRR